MSLIALLDTLTLAEPVLNVVALAAALKSGVRRRYPAVIAFLALRLLSGVGLLTLTNATRLGIDPSSATMVVLSVVFWLAYSAGTASIVFAVKEIFNELMSPLVGLRRLGRIVFRWVALVSLLVTVLAVFPLHSGAHRLELIGAQLMKCTGILEFCLLVFLGLTIHSLGRSTRSRVFGMALGFGIEALSQFAVALWLGAHPQRYLLAAAILSSITLLTACIWSTYFLFPESMKIREPLPENSSLMRWNEIAQALGHNPAHVAMGQSQAFFLQDVEKVVERVMTKNSAG